VDSNEENKPPDKLSRKELRARYDWTKAQLRLGGTGEGSIFAIFQKAYEENWSKELFQAEIKDTDWYRDNNAAARTYLKLKADPENADFKELIKDSTEAIRRSVMELGYPNLSDAMMEEVREAYLSQGMGEPGQEYELEQFLYRLDQEGKLEAADGYGGDIEANAQLLRQAAYANGVVYDEGYFISAGKSIASELSDSNYWVDQIREQAASKFPVFAEQIRLGANVNEIASPYIRAMAETWQLNPATITLDDPTILGALTKYDDKGAAYAQDLGSFMRDLREDPRWLETDEAQNKITGLTGRVMQMFGLMAG
jgi:hypothetical protein